MTNVPQDSSWTLGDFKDVAVLRYFREIAEQYPNNADMMEKAYRAALARGRDNSRTPMQWNSNAHGGFTDNEAQPWIRPNPNYSDINVAAQLGKEHSVLEFWKRIIALRKEYRELFIYGMFRVIDWGNESVFAFLKEAGSCAALVLLNFSDCLSPVPKEISNISLQLLLSTAGVQVDERYSLLKPWEGRVFLRLSSDNA